MGRIIEKVLIILMLAVAFFIGAFAAKVVYPAELPPEMSFLNDYPTLASGICTQKATGRQFLCDYKAGSEGDNYLIIWDGETLYEVIKSGADGTMETIFKTAKKLKL